MMTSLRATTNNNRGGAGEIETFAMANCLMILSSQQSAGGYDHTANSDAARMFSCKTCNRKFPSFQALGGHRASHNKNKPVSVDSPAPSKPKTHACSICGLEFPIGQALGGHMRRHRSVASTAGSTVTSEGSVEKSDGGDGVDKKRKRDDVLMTPSVLKKSNSCKRISLPLDLNLFLWKEDEGKAIKEEDEHEEGEIVEQEKTEEKCKEQRDFLKLELRQPINQW